MGDPVRGSFTWFARASWRYTRPMPWWQFALALPGRWRRFRELSAADWPGPERVS
jgi:hypothetical protein